MLTLNLRLLQRDGLITRHVVDDERRQVEYSLTPLGRDLSDLIISLIEWIDRRSGEITEARALFDAAGAHSGAGPRRDPPSD